MGFDPLTVAIIGGALSTGASIYTGMQQKNATDSAAQQAQASAEKQAEAADEATNRANQAKPDTTAILSAAQQAGKAGQSGTMLTGAQGIDPSTLSLSKTTLLGS